MWKDLKFDGVLENFYIINEDGMVKEKESGYTLIIQKNKVRLKNNENRLVTQNIVEITSSIFGSYKGYKVINDFGILKYTYGINEKSEIVRFYGMVKKKIYIRKGREVISFLSDKGRTATGKNYLIIYRTILELYNYYFNVDMEYSNKEIVLNHIFEDLSKTYIINIETGKVFIKKNDCYLELSKTGNRCTLIKNDRKQIRLSELKIAKITDTYIDMYNDLLKDTPGLSTKDLNIIIGIYIKNAINSKSL